MLSELRKRAVVHSLAIFAVANLPWEAMQTPLYTIWNDNWSTILFAVIHCTIEDVLIGVTTQCSPFYGRPALAGDLPIAPRGSPHRHDIWSCIPSL